MSGLEASLLLGSIHSVVLAAVLGRRTRHRRANRYLAALLGALSLLLLDGVLRVRGALAVYPHLIGLTAWVPFVLGTSAPAELADEVAATPHEVSQVLSTRLGRNFYTFVNEHRIEHVKVGLSTTDKPVLDLAFEAGFQSKSTFNSAFRKATGMTPREFRQRATS